MTVDDIERMLDQKFDQKLGVFVEYMNDQFARVLEVINEISQQVKCIPAMKQDIAELKSDMKIVKAAVTATNKDQRKLEKRVGHLESIAHSHA